MPTEELRKPTPGVLLLTTLFVSAGVLHFLKPETFDRIVPPGLPLPARTATLLSGAAELAGGLGLLHPATRPAARWGLLAAVFPANLYMAQHAERFQPLPAWGLWARLPLQPLLMLFVWRAGRRAD